MSTSASAAIVPAAGLGTRMKSTLPKFLHKICGRTMICHLVLSLQDVVDEIVIVVGNGKDLVIKEVEANCSSVLERVVFVEQHELLGSGHATAIGMTGVSKNVTEVMVALGDMPLLSSDVLNQMFNSFHDSNADVLVSTAILDEPKGYGRIVRDENKIVRQIVEDKDCDEAQKKITECNMYPFIFSRSFLETALDKLDTNNAQGEQYLTDVVFIARESSRPVASYTYQDQSIAHGVNDRAQLADREKIMREQINNTFMENGVTMVDPANTYIDSDVAIESDVTILPGTIIEGKSAIGSGCVLGPNTRIIDSVIGKNCVIESSKIVESTIEDDVTIGPFASLRTGTLLRRGVHVGTFVEMKKTEIGHDTKVPHLSYLGDTKVGSNTNLGAGTITANYDGKNKHQTTIGDNVKTGVNTVLVAPVELGDGVYTAAGAVVTKDVPPNSLAKGVPANIQQDWTPPAER